MLKRVLFKDILKERSQIAQQHLKPTYGLSFAYNECLDNLLLKY